jgi:hypothetical protein
VEVSHYIFRLKRHMLVERVFEDLVNASRLFEGECQMAQRCTVRWQGHQNGITV